MSHRSSLNHVYRTVWNQALGAMVAVAEISSGRGRASGASKRRKSACNEDLKALRTLGLLALGIAMAWGGMVPQAWANPNGALVVHGQATLASQGQQLTVTTQNGPGTNHSAINWQSFSIPSGNTTYFQQPNALSTVINRVVTNTPSLIFGTLGSNGNLVLVNQAGIAVGAGAVVDTAGFTASTLRMSDADAQAGRLRFGDGSSGAGLSVQGSVLARGGDVVLVAPAIDTGKSALIQSPNGSTILAAGQQVDITGRGLEGIRLQVQAPTDSAVNLGTLKGDAVGIFAGTLKHSGVIQATQASLEGGKVVLKASGDTLVEGAGQILATGSKGGSVDVLGQRVAVMDQANIDVSGDQGGGSVRIGGDYQGKNAAVQNANVTYFGPQATVKADALAQGDGGKVIVWADDTTRAYGKISARGGDLGGDGGFVENSGHRFLDFKGRVDTLAPWGLAGTLLLDPSNITIDNSSDVNIVGLGTGILSSSPTVNAIMTWSTINSQLGLGNLKINTDAFATSGQGDINITASGSVSGANTLSLLAHRRLNISPSVAVSAVGDVNLVAGWNSSGLAVSPGANNDIVLGANASLSTSGNVFLNAGNAVTQDATAVITANTLTVGNTNGSALPGGVSLGGTNMVNTLAVQIDSAAPLTFKNGKSLTIGSGAFTVNGIMASNNTNPINISTTVGDLIVAQPIVSDVLGGSVITLVAANTLVLGSAITSTFNSTPTGPVFLQAGAGGVSSNASGIITTSGLKVVSAGPVALNAINVVDTLAGSVTGSGFSFNDSNGFSVGTVLATNGLTVSNGDINLTTGAANSLLSISQPVQATNGNVSYVADNLAHTSTTTTAGGASNYAEIKPVTPGTFIEFSAASDVSGYLRLSTAELSFSTPLLKVGNVSNTGGIQFKQAVAPGAFNKLSLITSGAIGQDSTSGLTIANLSADGAAGVTLTKPGGNAVTNLAGRTTSGNFEFTSSGALNLATVDILTGINAGTNDVILQTGGALTDSSGSATITANTLTLQSGGGVALDANHSISIFNAANSSGNVFLTNTKPTLTVGSVSQSGGGVTRIENTGNMALGAIDGGGATVTLRAHGGNITDNNASAQNVFNSFRVDFNDASTTNPGGVGTLADPIEVYHATGPTRVSANAQNGGIYLSSVSTVGAMDLQGITHAGTSNFDIVIKSNTGIVNNASLVTTAGNNGNVLLESSGSGGVLVNSAINKAGSGTVTLRTTMAGQDVSIDSNVFANSGSVVLNSANLLAGKAGMQISGQNLTAAATGNIDFDTGTNHNSALVFPGSISLSAGGSVTANQSTNDFGGAVDVVNGTNVTLVDTNALVLGTMSHTGNLTATAGGAVTGSGVIGGGSINITATGGINLTGSNTATSVALNNQVSGVIAYKASTANLGVGVVSNTAASSSDIKIGNVAGNVTLNSPVSASASGSVITIAASGNFVNNVGASALTAGAGGKYLVYSTNPTLDSPGALAYDFKHYNQAFPVAAYAGPGVGNGFLYSYNPASLTPVLTGPVNKVYDGTVTVNPVGLSLSATASFSDVVTLAAASASFNDKSVGVGTTVTASGISVSSAVDGAAKPVYGYVLAGTSAATSGSITAKSVTLTAPVVSKTYDGGLAYSASAGDLVALTSSLVGGDSVTAASMSFSNKDAGAGNKVVSLSSATISDGNSGLNYSLTLAGNSVSTINPKPLTASLSAPNKTYDGTATATPILSIASGLIGSETVNTNATATFNTKDVLTANLVTVNSVALSNGTNGGLASNYSLSAGQTVAASITPANLSVTANNAAKTYDGQAFNGGNGVTFSGFVNGETASVLSGALSYGGTSQGAINVGSYAIMPGGLSSDNYAIGYVAGALTISPALLSTINLTGTRMYDGTANVAANIFTLSGLVVGEDLILSGVGTVPDKNVGNNKPVTLGSLALGDGSKGLAKNYTLTGGTHVASITPAKLTLSTLDVTKTYDGNLSAIGVPVVSSGTLFTGDTLGGGVFAFTDKNVGSGNKTVTVSAVAVGDGVNNGNYNVSYVSNNTSTIKARPLSSWIGPSTGLWSNPANWDALPDGANVLSVSIPSGATVVFDAATGSTSLQSLSSAGGFGLSGGSLDVSGAVSTQQFSQSGGVLSGAGTLSVFDSFSQTGGSVSLGGMVSVHQSSGNLTMSAVSAPAIALTAVNGNVNFTNVGAVDIQGIKVGTGNITVNNTGGISTSGPIVTSNGTASMTANSPLTIGTAGVLASGDIALTATNLTSPGNITLNGPVRSSGGSVTLTAANGLVQNSVVTAASNVQAIAGGAISFGPMASSDGGVVSYTAGGVPVVPPSGRTQVTQTQAVVELSSITADVAGTLETKLDEAVTDRGSGDGDPKKSKKDKEGVVVEGEACTQ